MLPRAVVTVAVLAALLVLAPAALAQSGGGEESGKATTAKPGKLTIGDAAPALDLGGWVKGEKITKFRKGHVYVIDFWATWCGPCIQAMPHMNELQKQHAGKATVLGISIWEHSPSKVEPFVAEKGDGIAYSVARDNVPPLPAGVDAGTSKAKAWAVANGAMAQKWMAAAGRNGIPSVFIIDGERRVAWIGHPMAGMDEALARIVAGDWDIEAARKAHQKAETEAQALRRARASIQDFRRKLRAQQIDAALAIAKRDLDSPAWRVDAELMNEIAWTIVDPAGSVAKKDMELAMKAAMRANELTQGKSAAIVDTVARVHFVNGDIDVALELQEKAMGLIQDHNLRAELQKSLDEYRKAKAEQEKGKDEEL